MSSEVVSSDQDFMVSLNIGPALIPTSKSQNQRDIQASYWKGIVPKDDMEIASTRPWILVHTASHSSPLYEQRGQFGMWRNGHSGYGKTPPGDKGSFCG